MVGFTLGLKRSERGDQIGLLCRWRYRHGGTFAEESSVPWTVNGFGIHRFQGFVGLQV